MKNKLLKLIIEIFLLIQIGKCKSLKSYATWKELQFEFPTTEDRNDAISSMHYIRENILPIDVDVYYGDSEYRPRVFITAPRFSGGVPITLSEVTDTKANDNSLIIRPYPEYEWHSHYGTDCTKFTSVFRVFIDKCHKLWILDSGRIGSDQLCPPQIFIFNLDTDLLEHKYAFPITQYAPRMSLFVTIILDVRNDDCTDVRAYIADVNGFGLLVYDRQLDRSWRVQNKLMYPYPEYSTITLAGDTFDISDGILGISLAPQTTPNRLLYFNSLSAITENAVPLDIIDNSTIWDANPDSMPRAFTVHGNRTSPSAAQAMDSNGNLFFGLMDPISLACWNIEDPYDAEHIQIVSENNITLQFLSGLKIIRDTKGEEMIWLLSCRFQKVAAGTLNLEDDNFRIQAHSIRELLGGRKCGARTKPSTTNPSKTEFGYGFDENFQFPTS